MTLDINGLSTQVLQKVQIGLCLVNSSGEIVFANNAASSFLNKSIDSMTGEHIHDVMHGGAKASHKKDDCPLMKPFIDCEPILREPDLFYNQLGEGIWTEFSSYPLLQDKELETILVSFVDATVSMRSQQTLQTQQAKFKAVFYQALYPKLILDGTGEILEANHAAQKILGEKIENTMLFDYFSSISQKKLKKFWKMFRDKGVLEERIELVVDGEKTPKKKYVFDLSMSKDIQPNMHLLSLLDVTKEHNRQVAQNQFIAVAGHELKTPLAVIKAYSELLERKYKGDERASQYVDKIKEKVDILTRLINAMVDEIKLGAGKLEFNNQLLDFNRFIVDVAKELQTTHKHNKIIVEGSCDALIEFDPERIFQVVANLVTNASKYSEKGEKIILCVEDSKKEVKIGVQDFGSGISKSEQAKLFNAFYRSPSAVKKKYPGLGLGLFISKQIVNHYGGDMWVESKWNEGSTFYFTLPKK